jgi:hypothetical protein
VDFSLYFTQLSVGCVALLPVVPWRAVGKGYYVMMLLIGLGLAGVSWLFIASGKPTGLLAPIGRFESIRLLAYTVLSLSTLLVFLSGRGEQGASLSRTTAIVGLVAVIMDVAGAKEASVSPAATIPLLAFNFVSSALLLGSVLSAMLLGHWYLVVKDLPVEPLKRLTVLFFVALAARLASTAAAFVLDPAGGRHVVDRSFLFVLVYGLFSLGCPIAMSWMVWGTVKIRSTQAATGILYGVVAFILMGEASARFVLIKTGFPL